MVSDLGNYPILVSSCLPPLTRRFRLNGQELTLPAADKVWDAHHAGTGVVGIRTGILDLDQMLGAFHRSDLIVVGSRPKMGKTAMLMNCARAAAKDGKRVGIASAEMPAWQLGERIVSDAASLSASVFRNGRLTEIGRAHV